jgi:GxxExxY protein
LTGIEAVNGFFKRIKRIAGSAIGDDIMVRRNGKLMKKAPHADLTYKVIGAAMAVHRKLGPGHGEKIYQKNLEQEFQRLGFTFESQERIKVYDENVFVGFYIPDFLVEGKVVVEIKALSQLDNSHVAQVITYLTATKSPVGLLLNFGERNLVYRRILPPKKVTQHHINYQWLFIPKQLSLDKSSKESV